MSSRESLGKRFGIEWKIVVVVGFSILGCCLFLALSALLMLALGYIKNFLFGDSRPGTSFYGYCVCCYRNNHKSQEKKLTIVPPPKKAYTPKKYKRQNETYTKSTTLKTNSHSEDVKEMEFTSLYTSASMDDIPSSERLETFSRAQSFAESSPSEIPRALLMTSSPTSV